MCGDCTQLRLYACGEQRGHMAHVKGKDMFVASITTYLPPQQHPPTYAPLNQCLKQHSSKRLSCGLPYPPHRLHHANASNVNNKQVPPLLPCLPAHPFHPTLYPSIPQSLNPSCRQSVTTLLALFSLCLLPLDVLLCCLSACLPSLLSFCHCCYRHYPTQPRSLTFFFVISLSFLLFPSLISSLSNWMSSSSSGLGHAMPGPI